MSIPVFNSFGDYANLQKSKAEYESAEEQVRMYRSGLAMQATNARWTVAATRKKAESSFKGLHVARDVLNALTRRYEMGGASGRKTGADQEQMIGALRHRGRDGVGNRDQRSAGTMR